MLSMVNGAGMKAQCTVRCPGARAGLVLLVLALVWTLGLTGCARWGRPRPMIVPADFAATHEAARLSAPTTYQAEYAKFFPNLPKVWTAGNLVVSGRLRKGKDPVDFRFVAFDEPSAAGQPGSTPRGGPQVSTLVLQATRLQQSLIDIIIRRGFMTVVDHPGQAVFQGTIPPAGSPFHDKLGVEPWDLIPIFTIGQLVATGSFSAQVQGGGLVLTPTNEILAKNLLSITLDPATGLPRSARWHSGDSIAEVEYRAWANYTDNLTGQETRLMPQVVRVVRRKPRVTLDLTLDRYRYDPPISERLLNPVIPGSFRLLPLTGLGEVF